MIGEIINGLYSKIERLEGLRNIPLSDTDPVDKIELYNKQ